ncbi:aminoacyl-tRNA hydrolase, partial [Acinetobacter baumannii]
FLKYYAYSPESVCVVHDDTAFPVGVARLSQRESSGGHNGLKSLIQSMGPHFVRYRLGIDEKPHPTMDLSDHVLGNFSPD